MKRPACALSAWLLLALLGCEAKTMPPLPPPPPPVPPPSAEVAVQPEPAASASEAPTPPSDSAVKARSREERAAALSALLAGGEAAREAPLDSGGPGDSARAAPTGRVRVAILSESVPVAKLPVTLNALGLRLRRCYQAGLRLDPDQQGRVDLAVAISAEGQVSEVTESAADARLSKGLLRCLASVHRGAQFTPPGGGGSTLKLRLTLTPDP